MLHKLTRCVAKHEQIKRPPGRPRKDQIDAYQKIITTYRLATDIIAPSEKHFEQWRQREATFVLITSVSKNLYDDYEVFKEYKGQIKVELRFRFLKDPMFVDAIYIKSPKRVQDPGYVLSLAVTVVSLMEMRIREAMAKEKATVLKGKRILDRPTARALLDILNAIQVVYLGAAEQSPNADEYRLLDRLCGIMI